MGREWREKPKENDGLAETKRLGCAGPQNELWVSLDFWFAGAEPGF